MSLEFHDVRFPPRISHGSRGGPERKTIVVALGNGHEERNQQWAASRRRYDAGYGIKTVDELHEVIAFFEERRGRLTAFRWKDWADFKSCAPRAEVRATDQPLGFGDGATKVFQLRKTYGGAFNTYLRDITRPVAGSVLIGFDGGPVESGFSVNHASGLVTFDAAPALGVTLTAGFEFDVPARFDTDRLEIQLDDHCLGSVPNIPIVEVL